MSMNFLHGADQVSGATFDAHWPERWSTGWAVTLSAAKLELGHLVALIEQLAEIEPALRVVHQRTLVSEADWQHNDTLSQAKQTSQVTAVQWLVAGELNQPDADFAAMVKAALNANALFNVDVTVMPVSTLRRAHKLALFDMDSTLIEQEVIVELAKKAGIGEQVDIITESAMRGEIDFSESFRRRVALLKGLDSAVLEDIIHNHITFSPGAKRLISTLKHNGYHVVLVSGGFTYFAQYVQQQLGIDEIYANDLDIVDGKLTGEVTSPIVDGQRKAALLQEVAQRLNIDLSETVAVGDGANDLPMLGLADIGIAYRAKPVVQQQAKYAVNVAGLDGVLNVLGLVGIPQ